MMAGYRWRAIIDPEVRAVFERGAQSGAMDFLYSTNPAGTEYYHFLRLDGNGFWHSEKRTKAQLVAG